MYCDMSNTDSNFKFTIRPYTLDNGLANDCWNNVCGDELKLPGKESVVGFSAETKD